MFDKDPNLYQEQMEKRRAFSELKFRKIELHPYEVIKHKKGYDALIAHQKLARAIHIPEYKMIRRVNGQD